MLYQAVWCLIINVYLGVTRLLLWFGHDGPRRPASLVLVLCHVLTTIAIFGSIAAALLGSWQEGSRGSTGAAAAAEPSGTDGGPVDWPLFAAIYVEATMGCVLDARGCARADAGCADKTRPCQALASVFGLLYLPRAWGFAARAARGAGRRTGVVGSGAAHGGDGLMMAESPLAPLPQYGAWAAATRTRVTGRRAVHTWLGLRKGFFFPRARRPATRETDPSLRRP